MNLNYFNLYDFNIYSLFFEIIFIIIISYYFYKKHKPNLKYLFLGYVLFIFTFIITIPIKLIGFYINNILNKINLSFFSISPLFISIILVCIFEVSKYFSLKKTLKTKSYKNAIFFAIGWSSIESLNIITFFLYNLFLKIFNLKINIGNTLSLGIIDFFLFFILNLAISVLVVISIIKKKKIYLYYAILFSITTIILMNLFNNFEKILFEIFIFIYSLYIIFKFNKLK